MAYADLSLAQFAAAVGERSPAPASGSATAVVAALAAALVELTARYRDDGAVAAAARLRERLLALADEDASAYTEYMRTRSEEARSRTVDVPLELAETAAAVRRLAERLERDTRPPLLGDAATAAVLARAAVEAAAGLVELNLGGQDDPRGARARAVAAEATEARATIEVRPLTESERPWAVELETESWGVPVVARLGELVDPTGLPGFVAFLDGQRAGLVSYAVRGHECEVVTIRSLRGGLGIGRALLDAVRDAAIEAGCRRLWLITTNNNLRALELYQRWGMDIVALHRDAVSDSRSRLKPSIPDRDEKGIPIAHELELELLLGSRPAAST